MKSRASATDRKPKPSEHPRDQATSTFSEILADLVARIPGARAAALVDAEGETVDYGGDGDPFDIRITAAQWQIVLRHHHAVKTLVMRGERRSFIVHALPDEYALVVLLGRRAGFAHTPRAFTVCERALCEEAGWTKHPTLRHWFPVEVTCNAKGRPRTVEGHGPEGTERHAVEVLGTVVGLRERERGFRVRLESGAEVTLVREPGACWYSEDPLREARVPRSRPKKKRTRDERSNEEPQGFSAAEGTAEVPNEKNDTPASAPPTKGVDS